MCKSTTFQLGTPPSCLPLNISLDSPPVSRDAGVLHLQQIDALLELSRQFADCLSDSRDPRYVIHSRLEQVQQVLFQLALGYPHRNDAFFLRHDPLFKLACHLPPFQPQALSSQPTLSRFENDIDGASIWRLFQFFVSSYIQQLPSNTSSLILDIDTTSSPIYGHQERSCFNGFYRCHMYHPLLIFDGHSNQFITAWLRPGNSPASRYVLPLLRRIIRGIKQRFPLCRIIVRADAGFAAPLLYEGLEKLNSELGSIEQEVTKIGSIEYEIGIARNQVLLRLTEEVREKAKKRYDENHEHIREFTEIEYAAQSWTHERRVIVKAEHHQKGPNPRFVVVSRKDLTPEEIYQDYCKRGQCENAIKDYKNAIQGCKLSCPKFVANFFRMFLAGGTYRLMYRLRQEIKEEYKKEKQISPDKLNEEKKKEIVFSEPKEVIEKLEKKRGEETKRRNDEKVNCKLIEQLSKGQFDTIRENVLKRTAWIKEDENGLKLQLSKEGVGTVLLAKMLKGQIKNTS